MRRPYNPERTHLLLEESKLQWELEEEVEEARLHGSFHSSVLKGLGVWWKPGVVKPRRIRRAERRCWLNTKRTCRSSRHPCKIVQALNSGFDSAAGERREFQKKGVPKLTRGGILSMRKHEGKVSSMQFGSSSELVEILG